MKTKKKKKKKKTRSLTEAEVLERRIYGSAPRNRVHFSPDGNAVVVPTFPGGGGPMGGFVK